MESQLPAAKGRWNETSHKGPFATHVQRPHEVRATVVAQSAVVRRKKKRRGVRRYGPVVGMTNDERAVAMESEREDERGD